MLPIEWRRFINEGLLKVTGSQVHCKSECLRNGENWRCSYYILLTGSDMAYQIATIYLSHFYGHILVQTFRTVQTVTLDLCTLTLNHRRACKTQVHSSVGSRI